MQNKSHLSVSLWHHFPPLCRKVAPALSLRLQATIRRSLRKKSPKPEPKLGGKGFDLNRNINHRWNWVAQSPYGQSRPKAKEQTENEDWIPLSALGGTTAGKLAQPPPALHYPVG